MGFWIRYLLLVLVAIVSPFGVGFYLDTQSEVRRSQTAGEAAAEAALPGLKAQLRHFAQARVNRALALAQAIADDRLMPDARNAYKPEVAAKLALGLKKESKDGGLAWAIDESGVVLARSDAVADGNDSAEQVAGHPLFVGTQLGFALDGFWRFGDAVYLVGAAPLVKDGEAKGAVFVGDRIGAEMIARIAQEIRLDLSALVDGEMLASTLASSVARDVQAKIRGENGSETLVAAGRLESPLPAANLPFLPLFVEKHADGQAYVSVAHANPGPGSVQWILSVRAADGLKSLAERQELVMGVAACALLLAFLFGLVMSRSYVAPIRRLVAHLSQIQQGRGERELPESSVSRPFRRLVKLLNMMTHRIPASPYGHGEHAPQASRPQTSAGGAGDAVGGIPSIAPPSILAPPIEGSVPGLRASLPAAADLTALDEDLLRVSRDLGRLSDRSSPAPAVPAVLAGSPLPEIVEAKPRADVGDPLSNRDVDRELQDAISALESQIDRGASAKKRSPSAIRGAAPSPSDNTNGPGLKSPEPSQQAISTAASQTSAGKLAAVVHSASLSGDLGALPPMQDILRSIDLPFGAVPGAQMGGSAFGRAGLGDPNALESKRGDATVVASPDEQLLRESGRDRAGGSFAFEQDSERTLAGETPGYLIAESRVGGDAADPAESAHYKETYERFIEMRKQCGESTADLAFDRFVAKLRKNRDGLIQKYHCKTVRFQVYEKDGKAALKATPVRT